jgi:hypothetical protein
MRTVAPGTPTPVAVCTTPKSCESAMALASGLSWAARGPHSQASHTNTASSTENFLPGNCHAPSCPKEIPSCRSHSSNIHGATRAMPFPAYFMPCPFRRDPPRKGYPAAGMLAEAMPI